MVIKICSFYRYPLQFQCFKYLRLNLVWGHPTQVLRSRCISREQIDLWWWLPNLCSQQCHVPAPRLVFKHCLLPSGLTNKPEWAQGHSLRRKERAVHGWPPSDSHLFLTVRAAAATAVVVEGRLCLQPHSSACLPCPVMFFNTDLLLTPCFGREAWLVRKGARQLLGQAGI